MKILVTGGLGFIGHNVVKQLQQKGHECVIVDNHTTYNGLVPDDQIKFLVRERRQRISKETEIYQQDIVSNLDNVFRDHRFDKIIHLASYPRQKVVNENPVSASRVMTEALLALLEQAHRNQVKHFVYVSSSMVYGDFDDGVTEDVACRPQGQYGIMKLAGEWLVKDYHRQYGLDYTIIRPSAVYGSHDVEDRVVSKFLVNAYRGNTLYVNGSSEWLDFTDVRDTAAGIVGASLAEMHHNKTYNITRSFSRSLVEAAELAVKIAGRGNVVVRERDQNFPSRGSLNCSAAFKDFGYDPDIDIEQGFREYYEWLAHASYWKNQ